MSALPVPTRLAECEAVIERGLNTFIEVGAALREVRDERLYRDGYATFEDYCRERWGWGRNYANKTIAAAETAQLLVGTNVPTPANEGVARELAPVFREAPERVEEVWAEAVAEYGPEPTAIQVRGVVTGATPTVPSAKPRQLGQQDRVVRVIVGRARDIANAATHLDLAVVQSLTTEEKDQWKQQLSEARTVLSRLINSL